MATSYRERNIQGKLSHSEYFFSYWNKRLMETKPAGLKESQKYGPENSQRESPRKAAILWNPCPCKAKCFIPARYLVGVFLMFGYANLYALRVNLSMALAVMVGNHTVFRDNSEIQVNLGSSFFGKMPLSWENQGTKDKLSGGAEEILQAVYLFPQWLLVRLRKRKWDENGSCTFRQRKIVGQKLLTLLDVTCCVRLHILLHVVWCCWELLRKV